MGRQRSLCILVVALFAAPVAAQQPRPTGAVARCGNGGFVFVSAGANTCAGYGGVAEWFAAAQAPPTVAVSSTTPLASNSPSGAVARCGNGWFVFVSTGDDTCAGYAGVAEWLTDARSAVVVQPTWAISVGSSPPPTGAVAKCGNGWYVFAISGTGLCQGYGSIAEWFVDPRTAPVASLAQPARAMNNRDKGSSMMGLTKVTPRPRQTYETSLSPELEVRSSRTKTVSAATGAVGRFTYYNDSNGVSGTSTKIGQFRYYNYSNGISGTSNRIGNFTYHNLNQNGDSTTGTSSTIGRLQFHNFSNGVTGTSSQVGGLTFHNFSNGTQCTSNQIGTFVYTSCN